MIIDFHTHVFPPWIRENRSHYLRLDPLFGLLYSSPRAKLATVEELVDGMDEAGVSLSVILNLGWAEHELCVETNSYLMESISRYPNRLVGFCAIQPKAGEAALAELERCVQGGIKGIGEMRPDIQGFELRDGSLMKPLFEMANKHHLILLTHASEPVGHQYLGKGEITPDLLYSFISSFPELRLVCAHWGGGLPFYALMPEVAAVLSNVFFDTAASPFLYRPQVFNQVVDILGPARILFGSDFPLIAQSRAITEVSYLGLPDEIKDMILGSNAQRLLADMAG